MAGLAGISVRYTMLVGRTHCHTWGRRPKEVSPENLHFLLDPSSQVWGPPRPRLHCAPSPKCLTQSRFLPNDPSYQDVQWQPLLLTMAYAQVLQYWMEKVRPPILNDYHPLAMSMLELKQHVVGYVTFNKWDVFPNLGSTTPKVISQDTGTPKGTPLPHPPQLMSETQSQAPWKSRGT